MSAGKRLTTRVLAAPPIFFLLGPLFGVVLGTFGLTVVFPAAMFFVLIGAYFVAGKACIVAGLLFSFFCLLHWKSRPGIDVGRWASVLVGGVAGFLGMIFQIVAVERTVPPLASGLWSLLLPSMISGALCAGCVNLVVEKRFLKDEASFEKSESGE